MIELRIHIEPLDPGSLSRPEQLTILRGQLTILRMRAEQGIPVSVEALARAEEFARALDLVAPT